MQQDRAKNAVLAGMVALLAIGLDQWSKAAILAVQGMQSAFLREVTGFFNLVLVWNHGMSFGLFAHSEQSRTLILLLVTLGIIGALCVWLWRNPPRHVALALGLIIGGGLGNIIDRLRHGAVVDFLDFHLAGWHWPAFNVADSCIFVGVVLLICDGMVEQLFQGKKAGDAEV